MLSNNNTIRLSSTISSSSSVSSLSDANLTSPIKKPPAASKATLRKELDEAIEKTHQLQYQQDTVKKINVKLTSELKSLRPQLKIAQEQLWELRRKVIGDDAESTSKDISKIFEIADNLSASHKGGLIGRIEELNQYNSTSSSNENELSQTAPLPLPNPAEEHLRILIGALYGDINPSFDGNSEEALKFLYTGIASLKQKIAEQACAITNYESQVQEMHSQQLSREKMLKDIAQEASSRTSQLDAEKNLIRKEALEMTSASDLERQRIEALANEIIRTREEEMARLLQEVEGLRDVSAHQAQLEARLLHLLNFTKKLSPRLLGSQTLGRIIYGDLHKMYASNWTPDSQANECFDCGKVFSIFYRRHHCRKCGRIFCGSHVNNILPLSLGDLNYSREHGLPTKTCDTCYQHIHEHKPLDLESVYNGADDQGVAMNIDTE